MQATHVIGDRLREGVVSTSFVLATPHERCLAKELSLLFSARDSIALI